MVKVFSEEYIYIYIYVYLLIPQKGPTMSALHCTF